MICFFKALNKELPWPSFSHLFFLHCCSTKLFLRDPVAPARTPTTALFIRGSERSRCRVPTNSSKCFTMCSPPPPFLNTAVIWSLSSPSWVRTDADFRSKVTHVGARGDTLKSNLIICVSPVCLHRVSARLLSCVHGCSCANKVLAVKSLAGWWVSLGGLSSLSEERATHYEQLVVITRLWWVPLTFACVLWMYCCGWSVLNGMDLLIAHLASAVASWLRRCVFQCRLIERFFWWLLEVLYEISLLVYY